MELSAVEKRVERKQSRSMIWFVFFSLAFTGCHLAPNMPTPRTLDDLLLETIEVAASEKATRESLVVTQANPDQHREIPAPADESELRLVQYEQDVARGPLVQGVYEDEDVVLTLQLLADQADATVVIDEQVAGTVNAMINDQPFELALDTILMPLGFIWKHHQGRYLIGTTDPTSSLFRYLAETHDYRPKHYSPSELLSLLAEDLQQYVRVIEKRNLIVIQAPAQILNDILSELKRADQPVPQVVLEAMVAVHAPESSYQFGFDLQHFADQAALNGVNIDLSGLAFAGRLNFGSVGNLFRNFSQTRYFLRCLEQNGYLDISASPRIMARDGEKAQISINRETFFSTQPQSTNSFLRQEIQKVDAGIILEVTPVIRGDTITVTIERAEVSEDIRESGTDPDLANPFPLINRRVVTTTVDVKDGETITIAGLTRREVVDRKNQVPRFRQIPLIGKLFQQIDQQENFNEVTVYISPRIVYPTGTEAAPNPTIHSQPFESVIHD